MQYLILCVGCLGCDSALVTQLRMVTASDLAGTYTGVLEGVAVDSQRQVIVDLDLLHEVMIRAAGALTVRIQSSIIPPLRAIVVGSGPVAINAEFVEFEGQFAAVRVKQIVFVKYEGEWIVVMQLVRVPVAAQQSANGTYVYQYVSYPSRVAARMSEDEAIRYVNTILRLISGAERN